MIRKFAYIHIRKEYSICKNNKVFLLGYIFYFYYNVKNNYNYYHACCIAELVVRYFGCHSTNCMWVFAHYFGMPWSPIDKNLGFFEVAFWFPEDVKGYGGIFAIAPIYFAWMAAFAEAVGGLFLLLGLQTRLFSFLIFCTMLVAIFMQQLQQGIWSTLPALGFLWVSIYGMVLGSGRFGFDYLLAKKIGK